MTVPGLPMLRGWYDEIKEPLASLGQSIPRIINPDFDLQASLRKRMIEDPAFAQSIANLSDSEREAFLQSLGAKRPATIQAFQNLQPGLQRLTGERVQRVEGVKEGLFNEGVSADREGVAATLSGGRTANAKETEALDIAGKKTINERNALGAEVDRVNLDKAKKEYYDLQAAWRMYPELSGIDMNKAIEDFFNGTGNPQLMTRIMSNPGAKKLWEDQLQRRFMLADQTFRQALQKASQGEDTLNNLNAANQITTQNRAFYAAELEKLEAFKNDPTNMGAILARGNTKLKEADKLKYKPIWDAYDKILAEIESSRNDFLSNKAMFQKLVENFYTSKGLTDAETLRGLSQLKSSMDAIDEVLGTSEPPKDSKFDLDAIIKDVEVGSTSLDEVKATGLFTNEDLRYLTSKLNYLAKSAPKASVGFSQGKVGEIPVGGKSDLATTYGADLALQNKDRDKQADILKAREKAKAAIANGYDEEEVNAALEEELKAIEAKYKS